MTAGSLPGVSVVIPARDNRPLLERFLPILFASLKGYGAPTEVVVVDDGSSDGTAEFLAQEHPEARVVSSASGMGLPGLGFPGACNLGAREARHEALLFLNSDVEVEEGFLLPLAESLLGEGIFGVAPAIFDVGASGDRPPRCESIAEVRFRRGVFEAEPWWDRPLPDAPLYVFYAPAAALLVWRDKFEHLGGFDSLFAPYSWEDVDLCYRAWRSGWRVVVTPRSRVKHYRSSTVLRTFEADERAIITHRNQLLVVWKDATDARLVAAHLAHLPLHLGAALVRGRWWYWRAVGSALARLPAAWRGRRRIGAYAVSDREVLELASVPRPVAGL